MNTQKIGNFIKTLRKEKNLTQKELAEKLNITDRAISRWERGIGCPDISLLEDLSKILEISVLELLKGEKLEENKPTNKNIIETFHFGKITTISWLKNISNILTIIIISIFSLFIIITNIKSIALTKKTYNYKQYLIERTEQITIPKTIPLETMIEETETKIETILSNKGNYQEDDYINIQTHIKLLKDELDAQNNQKYLQKTTYNFLDLLNFYIEHQNLLTPLVDHKDLYSIIISYEPSLSDNLIQYTRYEDSLLERYFHLYNYLEQPYYIQNHLPYQGYTPNPYTIIESIYTKHLRILNDIMKAGEIK